MIDSGELFAAGIPGEAAFNPETDRITTCGSMDMIKELGARFENLGFEEGSNAKPGAYAIERAFVG